VCVMYLYEASIFNTSTRMDKCNNVLSLLCSLCSQVGGVSVRCKNTQRYDPFIDILDADAATKIRVITQEFNIKST